MAFLDFLFGAKANKEEEDRKKREQEQAGKRVNDAINKWLTDNSSKWTPAGTQTIAPAQQLQNPTFTTTQQPQTPTFTAAQPTISGDVYNNILNSRFGTPNLSGGSTKKISGNSPLLINDDAITGNRKGWGYGSGDAPSKEAAKEWDDLLNPDSSLSKSMDKQRRLWRINNEVPAWYVNAHKQGTVDSVMQNVGSNHLLPEDGNIAMGTRNNTTKSVAALYDQRQTGRFDYDIDPWGNLADPSLYSDDYLQDRLDYWKDQSTAKKAKTENAIHSIEDINDAMAWTFNARDFEHDTDPVSDFELEGFARYVDGTEFDPNMTNDERQAMANRFLEWGKDDGYLKLQEKLNSQRTGHESTYVENAGVSDAYEDWLGKLEKEAQFRFDYGHMQEEARRDPNFEVDAAYDGPISGNDFASRLYNALNDPLERIKFDLPYENGGAANPITAEGYDLMTPQELQEFNWYAKRGRGQEYLDMMKATLQHRNAEAQAIVSQYYATKNFGTAALSWGAARFANLGTAMMYPIQAANALLGGETDAASSLYAPNRLVNDVSEAQTQVIANSNFLQIPGFAPGTNLGTWLYSAATSAADSLLGVTVGTTLGGGPNSGLGKALANLVMSSTAASQSLEENLLSGMDPTHAFFTSVADGAAEAITETWSIESLLSDPTHFIPYLAKNFFSEASEEGASSILEAISDRLINGDNSQMANDVNMLVLLGMKKEDAEKRVLSDWLNETLQGMAIGGLSGGMSAGGWAMGNAIGEAGAGRRINQTIFQNALNSYTMDQNRQANQTQTVTNEQAQEDGRRAPETPDKAPMDRMQDDTQSKTTPDEKAPDNDQRKAPETPDKAPIDRMQDDTQPKATPDEKVPDNDQRKAPDAPNKPPMQREQDTVNPVQTDGVNAQTDNVNGDVDGRRAPTQPIQQSARQAEADQAQAAANEKAAQPAEPAKRRAPNKPTKEARQQGDKAVFETQQKVAEIGAGLAEGSEARKVAEAALKQLQKGKRLGNRQTYRLYSQVYNQLDEDLAAPIKSAARQDIEYQLVKDGVEKDQARYAAKSLADILTGNIDNVSDADLNDLLTTKQTRDILHAVGIDSTVLNRKILSMAGNNPIINLQLRQSAYERPENRSTMDSWSMMRRIIEGQYTYQAESGEAKATDGQKANQEYKPTGAKEQITFADADGNDVTGTIVKITTKAAGQKAMAELKEKAATQPASQQTKSTNQQTSNNEAMDGLSDEAKEEWKKIQADRENGPREVKIEGGNGPTMEEFHNMRSQMSARMGEENIDSVNDIVLTVRDGDGNTREISIDDVSGASNEGVQAILEYAMATPEILGTNKLNLMYQWYQGEQPVEYMAAFNHVYNAGFTGYVMDPAAVSALGDSRSEFIYEAGRQAAQEAEKVRLENIKNVGKGQGTLTIQGIDNSSSEAVNTFIGTLDENQRASYEALKVLSQAKGFNIVLFKSQADANGRITSENGHYDPYTNSLYLDLNAGLNMSAEEYAAQGMSVPHYAILRTAGHELTHYIENSSAEGYAKLRAYAENELMRRYGSETFEDLIERKMDAYARAGNPLTREGAISEVIADSMEMILQDSRAIERLANQDRTVFQRIRDFLHDFAENIRRAFTGVEAGSLEAQLLLQDAEGNPVRYAEKLVKLWDDALIEASAANAVADQTEAQQSVGVLAPSADEDQTISGDRTGFIEMPKDRVQDSVRTYLDMEPKAVGPAFLKNHNIPYEVHSTGIKGRRTVYASGRDITRAILMENGFGKQTDEVLSFMDNIADYMKDAEVQYHYVGLTDVNSATATIDPDSGKILLSCKIKNDEYEVNFDLGTVCKKRQALQNLFNELAARNGKNGATKLDDIELTSEHIFRINEILRDNGYETACLGCFVEARRYKTKAWADRVVGEWNAEVLKQNPNAGYFDFARGRTDIDKMSAAEQKAHYDALKAYNSKDTSGPRDRMKRLAKIPTMQKLLRASDLISEQGRDRLRKFSSTLDSIAQSRDGANAIKPTIGFIPYNSEMALLPATKTKHGKRMTMAQYLKSIGGARSQSFTDFIVTQAFDHLQKTVDMAARKVTAHTYTKELGRAWLFGMTGEKINMSVLFDIDPKQGWQNAGLDANGEYIVGDYVNAQKQFEKTGKRAFTQSIPFKQAVELEHNPLYSKNVGIIGVGYSYNHMKKMLSDENIPYIIMYHRSGMPQEVATAANIAMTTDYTPVQNTQRFLGFRTVIGDGHGVPSYASWGQLSQKKTGASKMTYNSGENGLSLKQLLADHNGDPIAAMNDLLSWMEQNKLTMNTSAKAPGHGDFDLYGSLNRTMDPTATANEYIKWCMQNEMLPLGWEFCTDPGYYKILYDYSVTDLATGETATQQPVTLDKMLEIGPEQWKAGTDGVHGLDHFMAAYDRTLDRDQSVFEQTLNQVYDELAEGQSETASQGPADVANPTVRAAAVQHSLRLEPMTTTREYIMGLTDDDLQTEAERAVLAKYRQKVTEYGTAAAAREKYENDLLNYNGQDQNELTKLNNRAQLARERLNRVQAELEQIEKSNAFVRIAADARQAMSVIQSVAGSGNVDQYLETMRTRLANAQSRMDDILKDLEGWPKPTEGTTARMVFGKTQLNQKVSDLMKANPSTLSKDEVTDSLAHIALLYQIGDTQAIEDANREVEELARKLQLQKNESIESYELTQLSDAIGAFSLNDNQKKEVKRVYGSISNFKKALQGYGRYDPKATNLDANWNEMVELTGNQLDPNIGDAEEPIALVDYISRTVQSAQEAAALSPEDAQNELIEIQTEILTAATDLQAAIPMSRETLTAIQDLIKTFGSRADKLGDQLVQLLHDSEHARANADLAQATYTANGGRIIKGVDAIRSYYSQVADQYTKEILLQKERELRDRYANQMRILRTNAAQRLQEQANNYRQQIKDVRELRDISQKIRTARNVVRRQVMRVNKLLLQETNTKNVPEGLKGMAEALVTAFARADQNGRGIILSEGEANNLILEYSYLMRRDGELDSYAYDPDVLEQLKTIKDQLDEYRMASIGHAYYDLNNQRKRLAICQNIAATVNDLVSLIVNANYAFIDGKKVDVGAAADRIAVPMLSMKDYGRPTGGIGRMASNVDEFARWGNMTPYYFKRQIDNAGFTPLMDDLEKSEHRWGLQMQSAHDRINELRENYHAADWDDDKLSISDNRGGTIEITRGQAMSILAIWQREHHDKYFQSHHLEVGGFVLAEDGGKLGKGLLGLDRNAVGRTRGARVTQAEINAIEAWLTDEQKAYMNEMISYLSNEMSDIGNETSMKLYGIKKYKEKAYFPIQSYRGALTMKSDAGAASTTNDSRIEHVGFSNARLRDANNTILIDDFSKVAAGHIQQMLMYANFAPTIEALNKVLNAQFEFEDGEKMRIRQMFENKYGKNAKDYLQDYIKALNGGVNPDRQEAFWGKLTSMFKKTAVVGSLSVAAKQPMSIIRAAAMINPRYLAAAAAKNLTTMHGQKSFDEARKYAGTAVIKDIGKFDTGVGMSNVDWLLERDSQEYDLWTKAKEALNPRDWETWKARWNDILGFLPSRGDSVTWGAMWEAVKLEQHALHPSMNQYSQEFLQMCGERFNTVMRATQVYDSTIAKAPNIRSTSTAMKTITAFMNEPVLTVNMLYDSIRNAKKTGMKDHINPATAGACVIVSAIAQAFITSLFSAIRSDDKEKTIAEKMAGTFGQNLQGEINPLNMIPGVKDIVDILEGGTLERTEFSALTEVVTKMGKAWNGQYAITDLRSGYKFVEDIAGGVAKLFGVPVKNIMREVRSVWNIFTQPDRATNPTVFRLSLAEGLHVLPDKFLGFTLVDTSTQAYVERMYKALRSGDTKAAADYREYLIDGKGVKEGSIKSKIKSLLYADYAAEQIGIDEAIQFGMDQELWKKEKDAYSALIQAADKADHSDQEEYKTSAYVKIYDALLAGDKAAYNAAAKDMASHGYTDKAVQSEAKSQIGKWYKEGELTQTQATSMLAMLGVTAKNDVYWTLDAWDYQAENGDSTGYTKYDDFFEAVESGKGLQAAIQAQVQHSDKTEKEVRSTLASQITSKYKDQYVELVRAGRTGEAANLQARLLTAYEALGYNRAKKLKDIQKWLK